jgi:Co/Zn/Cd efflux system component
MNEAEGAALLGRGGKGGEGDGAGDDAARGVRRNVALLLAVAAANGVFSLVQLGLSVPGHSLALGSDSMITFGDSLTYVLNAYSEREKAARGARALDARSQLLLDVWIPLASAVALLVAVVATSADAVLKLVRAESGPGPASLAVNETIVLILSALNALMAVAAIVSFFSFSTTPLPRACTSWSWSATALLERAALAMRITKGSRSYFWAARYGAAARPPRRQAAWRPQESQASRARDELEEQRCARDGRSDEHNYNLESAMLHIGADLLRSVTVLSSSLFARANPSWSSVKIDAAAALAVDTLICLALLPFLCEIKTKHSEVSAAALAL